jgi:UDP-2,3-diacylglucosamine hydrolase
MKVHLFISDVHLGLGTPAEERVKEDALLSFLDARRSSAAGLFILGDLFDFWFDYATVVPRGFHRTLTALQAYTDAGIPVHFLVGNHDFWMRDFFSTEIGVTIHREPFETTIGGLRVYIHHGDGLAANDIGYRILKPILRNPLSAALYRWIHPDIGVRLARGSSRSSRSYTSKKDYGEGEAMAAFAAERIKAGADVVVMGHTHEPELQRLAGGLYINLGDWITHRTYGMVRDGAMTLERWTTEGG